MKSPVIRTPARSVNVKWVAISKDNKVVDSAKTLVQLSKKVEGKDVTYMKIPISGTSFAF